jgi:hypothetical protein
MPRLEIVERLGEGGSAEGRQRWFGELLHTRLDVQCCGESTRRVGEDWCFAERSDHGLLLILCSVWRKLVKCMGGWIVIGAVASRC